MCILNVKSRCTIDTVPINDGHGRNHDIHMLGPIVERFQKVRGHFRTLMSS